MLPFHYRSRSGEVYYDIEFTEDWGPFRRGEQAVRLMIDSFDCRILIDRKGGQWEWGVPFIMQYDESRKYDTQTKV